MLFKGYKNVSYNILLYFLQQYSYLNIYFYYSKNDKMSKKIKSYTNNVDILRMLI